MPQVVAYIGQAFAAVGAGTATLGQILTVIAVQAAATAGLNTLMAPDASSYDGIDKLRGNFSNGRVTAQPRVTIYGQARVGGQVVYLGTSGSKNEYLNMVIVHAEHEIESIETLYLNGEAVNLVGNQPDPSDKYSDHLDVYFHLGTDSQVADANLVAETPDWTSDHRLRGCAYTYLRMKYDAEDNRYPHGIPNVTVDIKGKKVYNFVTDVTEWSDNWALCTADYIKTVYGSTNSDFSLAEIQAATNLSDELVTLNDMVSTEKRYTVNGTILADEDPSDVLEKLKGAANGFAEDIGGLWFVHGGAYRAPSESFDEGDFAGPISITGNNNIQEMSNRVRGVFANKDELYRPVEFPPVTNATYLSEDLGVEKWADLEFLFTTSAATCQRLAKQALEQSRQGMTIQCTLTNKALRVKAGDTVQLSFARYGFVNKEFMVVSHTLVVSNDDNNPIITAELTLLETASGIYDWANGEETTLDIAPNTTLPDPWTVEAPVWGDLESGTNHLIEKNDGTLISQLYAPWTTPDDANVAYYELAYNTTLLIGSSIWIPLPNMPVGTNSVTVPNVADGVEYGIRIRSVSTLGVKSAWVQSAGHTIIGKTALPATPTGLTAVAQINGVRLLLDENTEKDFSHFRIYAATTATKPVSHDYTTTDNVKTITGLVADQIYYFWVESVDTSGNISSTHDGPVNATPDAADTGLQGPAGAPAISYSAPAGLKATLHDYSDYDPTTCYINTVVLVGGVEQTYAASAQNDRWRYDSLVVTGGTGPTIGSSGELSLPTISTNPEQSISGSVIYRDSTGTDFTIPFETKWIQVPQGQDGTEVMEVNVGGWSVPTANDYSDYDPEDYFVSPVVRYAGVIKSYNATPTNDSWLYVSRTYNNGTERTTGISLPTVGFTDPITNPTQTIDMTIRYRDLLGNDHDRDVTATFLQIAAGDKGDTGDTGPDGENAAGWDFAVSGALVKYFDTSSIPGSWEPDDGNATITVRIMRDAVQLETRTIPAVFNTGTGTWNISSDTVNNIQITVTDNNTATPSIDIHDTLNRLGDIQYLIPSTTTGATAVPQWEIQNSGSLVKAYDPDGGGWIPDDNDATLTINVKYGGATLATRTALGTFSDNNGNWTFPEDTVDGIALAVTNNGTRAPELTFSNANYDIEPLLYLFPAVSVDGVKGDTGNKTVTVFKSDSSGVPDTPTGDNTPAGWSATRPNGQVIWVSKALQTDGGTTIGAWSAAVRAEGTATFFQSRATITPTTILVENDLVFDTTENNRMYRWNGSAWADVQKVLDENEILTVNIEDNQITAPLVGANKIITTAANIEDAVITDAKIANLSAGKITAGSMQIGQYIESDNYDATHGWRLEHDLLIANDALFRGTVDIGSGDTNTTIESDYFSFGDKIVMDYESGKQRLTVTSIAYSGGSFPTAIGDILTLRDNSISIEDVNSTGPSADTIISSLTATKLEIKHTDGSSGLDDSVVLLEDSLTFNTSAGGFEASKYEATSWTVKSGGGLASDFIKCEENLLTFSKLFAGTETATIQLEELNSIGTLLMTGNIRVTDRIYIGSSSTYLEENVAGRLYCNNDFYIEDNLYLGNTGTSLFQDGVIGRIACNDAFRVPQELYFGAGTDCGFQKYTTNIIRTLSGDSLYVSEDLYMGDKIYFGTGTDTFFDKDDTGRIYCNDEFRVANQLYFGASTDAFLDWGASGRIDANNDFLVTDRLYLGSTSNYLHQLVDYVDGAGADYIGTQDFRCNTLECNLVKSTAFGTSYMLMRYGTAGSTTGETCFYLRVNSGNLEFSTNASTWQQLN